MLRNNVNSIHGNKADQFDSSSVLTERLRNLMKGMEKLIRCL